MAGVPVTAPPISVLLGAKKAAGASGQKDEQQQQQPGGGQLDVNLALIKVQNGASTFGLLEVAALVALILTPITKLTPPPPACTTQAQDWGSAALGGFTPPEAPLAPTKPDERRLREELGRTTYLPKARVGVATMRPPPTMARAG